MKVRIGRKSALAICAAALFLSATPSRGKNAVSWNPKAAADYLDQRENWWMNWPPAASNRGTFCISCHTAAPYALARPELRRALAEESPSANERDLMESVRKRVRFWSDANPFFGDNAAKKTESRGTEAILNALILASFDARQGALSAETRAAFENMWALQERRGDNRGSWAWLNYANEPWEAADSRYYGACLAAIAVGIAPRNYRSAPEIQDRVNELRDYLNTQYAAQALMNRVAALWASSKLPGLLTAPLQRALIEEIFSLQRSDGGWSLSSMAWAWKSSTLLSLAKMWIRSEGTPFEARSDGYATGLVVFVLQEAGLTKNERHLQDGLNWLVRNQDPLTGSWPGYSLNRRRAASSGMALFMNDAATAYSVLALAR